MRRGVTLVNLFQGTRGGDRVLPLGCLWLRAALEARGVDTELRDFQFLGTDELADIDGLAERLDDSQDVLGVSVMADLLPLSVALGRRLKARRPERTLVYGGWGPTTVAGHLVESFPWIDVVARGEGDETLPEVVAALDGGDLRRVLGLDGWIDGERFHTPDRSPVQDVSTLAEPRYDDLDVARYSYYTSVTARGCPYTCRFCEIPMMEQRRVRNRSVDAVVAELVRAHREHGVSYVGFQDDIFLLSKRRVGAILDGVEREGIRMTWGGFARAGRVDRAWYAELRDRGMTQVTFGIEAGSDRLLDRMAKGLTLEKAFSGIRDALASGSVRAFFLWGFPYETLADFLGTAQAVFHAELLGVQVEVGQVVPLPGSQLYLEHQGPLELHDRYPFCRLIRVPSDPELYELVTTHPKVFPAFYSFPTPDREVKWELASQLCCRES